MVRLKNEMPFVFAKILLSDSFILVAFRVIFLLYFYSPSLSEMFSPSVEVIDDVISDLSASIIIQSSLLDEALLDDLEMTEEFLTVIS